MGQLDSLVKSFLIQISSFKVSMASLTVALLAFSQASLEAVIVVNGTNPEYRDNLNDYDAYYSYYDNKKSSANIANVAFLTTGGGNSGLITTYNDGKNEANSDNPNTVSSTSLTLAQAGALSYNDGSGTRDGVAFYISSNQQGKGFYGVERLEIYTSATATVDSLDDINSGPDDENIAYKFDSGRTDEGNGTGQLQLFYGSGNSNWDVQLIVPLDKFTLINNDYQQTYVQFVVEYTDTAGSDSWQYDANTTLIPEPSSSLLISLGAILGLLRRRR